MRIMITLLFTSLLIIACKNNNQKDTERTDKVKSSNSDSNNNDNEKNTANKANVKNNNSSHNWTRKEQNKFLEDCEKGSGQQLTGKKLKDFCSCMLLQAQKYYSTYSQMDEKSDEDNDRKILENCAG